MNDIDRWFERAARREGRTVSLYASLLTGRIARYFAYRMRYALLLDGTRYVIQFKSKCDVVRAASTDGGFAAPPPAPVPPAPTTTTTSTTATPIVPDSLDTTTTPTP